MKKKLSVLSVVSIIIGLLETVSNGYEIIGGGAPVKSWVMLALGLFMIVIGILTIFGKMEPSQTSPKEEYMIWLGISIGWGACTLISWIDRDCIFDLHTGFCLLALVFCIVWTIEKKGRIPKESNQ